MITFPTMMYRSNVQGEGETEFISGVWSYSRIDIIENKIIYNDEFVYYTTRNSDDVFRVGWDGGQGEAVSDWDIPRSVIAVEDDFFYASDDDWWNISQVSRYSIIDNELLNSYTIPKGFNFMNLYDGWVYFGGADGIFKADMNGGETIKLTDLPQGTNLAYIGFRAIIDDELFFTVPFNIEEDFEYIRLFKVSINGGEPEYQNVKWFES